MFYCFECFYKTGLYYKDREDVSFGRCSRCNKIDDGYPIKADQISATFQCKSCEKSTLNSFKDEEDTNICYTCGAISRRDRNRDKRREHAKDVRALVDWLK